MPRLCFLIAYNGKPFDGWQSQPHGKAVQDHIERALECVVKSPVRIHGSGRTDAGVHALGQVAHFDLDANPVPAERWPIAINCHLPPEIRVMHCEEKPGDFHARFSAVGKIYEYRVRFATILPPMEHGRVWLVPGRWRLDGLTAAATAVSGRHDFAAFAANRGHPEHDTVRSLKVFPSLDPDFEELCTIRFEGDGFLYRMVRLLTGAMVQVATGRIPLTELERLLEAPRGETCRFCAPADGLTLVTVLYPNMSMEKQE